MNLVVDIGNTLVKLAVFEGDRLVDVFLEKKISEAIFFKIKEEYPIKKAIYSSVRDSPEDLELLKKHNFSALAYDTSIPLSLKYKTPKTLGLDRIAASVGALTLFGESNLLVIDMGTCVTFDFISKKKDYLGGAIAPGIQMRLKALHHFTEKLPIVRLDEKKVVEIGKTTEESILSGVYWGVKHEIEGTISRYRQQYEGLKIVITGGDIKLFDFEPKNRIFADEFLVLKGLNEIVRYNEVK